MEYPGLHHVRLCAYDSRIQPYAKVQPSRVASLHTAGKETMAERPTLSKGEMEVARVLWEIGPAPVRTVHASLSESRAMEFATVQTYLRRLEAKGYATSRLDGRIRVYAARTKPRTVIRETVDDLVARLFGGKSMPLVRHLIEEGEITGGDLAELRELLDRLEQEGQSREL